MYLLYETDPDWLLSEIAVDLQSSSFCLFVTLFVLHKYFTNAPFDMEYIQSVCFQNVCHSVYVKHLTVFK